MAFAELDGAGKILVQTTWSEKDVVRQVPGARWDAESKDWRVPLSWSACIVMRGVFQHTLTVGPGLNQWAMDEIARRVQPCNELRVQTVGVRWDTDGHDRFPGLRDFQVADVDYLLAAGDALLCNDMGTGKTVSLLSAMRAAHLEDSSALPALVVCPNSVKIPWGREAARWFPEAVPYVVRGTPAVRAKVLAAAAADPLALVIVNYDLMASLSKLAHFGSVRRKKCRTCDKEGEEGLKPTSCEVHPKVLNEMTFRTVILDEAHRLKNPKAKWTRAVWSVAQDADVVRHWGATGTPLANNPEDLWAVFHALCRPDFPTKSQFVDRYCLSEYNPYGTLSVVGIQPEHREEFFRIVDPRIRRMPKELVLRELPDKIRSMRFVELSPKARKAYDEVSRDFLTRLGDETLLAAPGSFLQQTRLMQLASAYCTVDMVDPEDPATWVVHLADPSPKIDELLVVRDELGGAPFVACAESRKLVDLASARLTAHGIRHSLIVGGQNDWERQRNLDDFQEGRVDLLLFTIKAGGTGLTMTRAGSIVFMQRSWSMLDNLQAEDRVHRIGSEGHEAINVIDLVTMDTLEYTRQLPALYEKFERLQEILRDRELLVAAGLPTDHLDREANAIRSLTHVGAA